MFLKIKRAPCSDSLNALILMVKETLLFSTESLMESVDFVSLEARLEPEVRHLLHYKAVKEGVAGIFQIPYLERLDVYHAFCEDICFEQHIDDELYCFHKLSPTAHDALNQLCKSLYRIVRNGNMKDLNLRLLQEQYAEQNGERGRICPACVREILFNVGEGELDHYFPRKGYPMLILHPYNIVPLCSDCNGARYKHTKNPIDEQDIGPGELQTVFLPYLRAADHEVDLSVSEDHSRKIVMSPKPDSNMHTAKRIENTERLFKLGDRWSSVLSNVYDDLVAELSDITTSSLCKEDQIRSLRQLLWTHKGSTKHRIDFIKGVYCAWLDTKSDHELADMLLNISLKTEAEEIY
jgi:hypothetical protein